MTEEFDCLPEDDNLEDFRLLASLRSEWLRICADVAAARDRREAASRRRLAEIERRIAMTPAPYHAMVQVKLDVLRRHIHDGPLDPRTGLMMLASIEADL